MKFEIQEFFMLPMEGKRKLWQEGDLVGFGEAFAVSEEQKLDCGVCCRDMKETSPFSLASFFIPVLSLSLSCNEYVYIYIYINMIILTKLVHKIVDD